MMMMMTIFRGGETCPAGHKPVNRQGPACFNSKLSTALHCIARQTEMYKN